MKPRTIRSSPKVDSFSPSTQEGDQKDKEPIILTPDEWEALCLVDYKGLLQESAATQMGVSRGTVWRCLDNARRKVATALAEGRHLILLPLKDAQQESSD